MKKLFATLLAATMIAGTAVSAFAYIKGDQAAVAASKDDDYTLSKNAYDKDGKGITNKVGSGDKIYYPILVDGEELNKDGLKSGEYYYATSASEVDNLKVSLKAVRGGKYIKGATIVRKDLNFGKAAATKATFTLTAKVGGVKVAPVVDGYAAAVEKTKGENAVAAVYTLTATGNAEVQDSAAPTIAGYTRTKTVSNGASDKPAVFEYTATVAGAVGTDGRVAANSAGYDAVVKTAGAEAVKAVYEITATAEGKKDAPTSVAADYDVTVKTAGTDAKSSDGKVYCVEVALADYFGTDENEIDYDLTLRTKSTQYETKDAKDAPRTSFDIGNEADTLEPGKAGFKKFRNGELTLSIDKNTRSLKLDEAKEKAGEKAKDVERIFLEGDSFDFEVKASGQNDLYLELNSDANKKVIVANQDAKMTFFNFPGKPEFDFTGVAKFAVEDPDKSYYFYEIVDDKPVKTNAKYNKEDDSFELRTRTLGSYVISDKELGTAETPAEKPSTDKPSTDKPAEEKPVNPTTPGKNVPTGAIA